MSSKMENQNVTVLDETSNNYLVQYPDGRVENVSRSPQNRLLFDVGLWGLLKERDTTWRGRGDRHAVDIIPHEERFTLSVDDNSIELGPEHEADLVKALAKQYEDEYVDELEPLIDLYDEVSEGRVRQRHVNRFLVDDVVGNADATSRGWLFNDHVLLTYDAKIVHPGTTSRKRQGSLIKENSATDAYDIDIQIPQPRNVQFPDGTEARLSESEMEFLAKALWLEKHAPRLRDD
jgi:hypothetical protein